MPPSQNGNSGIDEAPIIFTTDEEGVEHRFQMIDMIEVDGQTYGLLLYLGEEQEPQADDAQGYDEEVVVMRIIEEDGEQVFEAIEDEDEFAKVVAYVEAMEAEEEDDESLGEENN